MVENERVDIQMSKSESGSRQQLSFYLPARFYGPKYGMRLDKTNNTILLYPSDKGNQGWIVPSNKEKFQLRFASEWFTLSDKFFQAIRITKISAIILPPNQGYAEGDYPSLMFDVPDFLSLAAKSLVEELVTQPRKIRKIPDTNLPKVSIRQIMDKLERLESLIMSIGQSPSKKPSKPEPDDPFLSVRMLVDTLKKPTDQVFVPASKKDYRKLLTAISRYASKKKMHVTCKFVPAVEKIVVMRMK